MINNNDNLFSSFINVKSFGAVGDGVTDDTVAITSALNSTTGLFGSTIYFPKGQYLVRSLVVNKPGFTFIGDGNRTSQIVGDSELTIKVQPLWNGSSFTNSGFGGFYTNGIGVYAISDLARTGGVGIRLINCFSTNANDLYVHGFKKNVELCGSHFNKFNNLYVSDEIVSDINPNEEIFNRGYAISVSRDIFSGETQSTSIFISNGWLHNTSLDLENCENGIIENIDIEPASQSVIVGSNIEFRKCRFERMDYYAIYASPTKYPPFNWFIIKGNANRFINNNIHSLGANNVPFVNSLFKVESNDNYFDFKNDCIHYGLIDYDPDTVGNTCVIGKYRDPQLFNVGASNAWNMETTPGIYEGNNNYEFVEANSSIKCFNGLDYIITNCLNLSTKMTALPFIQGATKTGNSFTVIDDPNHRIIMNFGTTNKYDLGVYVLKFRIKSPDNYNFDVRSTYTNSSFVSIKSRTKNRYLFCRFSISLAQEITPTIDFSSFPIGSTFELSEVELLKFDSGKYVENLYPL
ncbi:glycosyl hydrolase family 28-related protein [Pedobacter cryoconitis]|uniref:Rhamnogalacturonase A/B/Epimerase-like pectate lyase domain-containing protein n=1 Tax=Pedobacter cryoconitis TaxID=188932 RepID=A0A7X0J9X5_9SPHI|nr:glycosyl hydrolase family 28-related protein [Pedobacter cryoconitis]MBB6502957.1 hypothetical protein [Pedobacter cryoconitis]